MAQNIVRIPSDYFGSFNQGRPVFNGSVYVGDVDKDPEIEANRKTVTITQEDGTQVPIAPQGQPLLTGAGGYITYQGSPVTVKTDGNYSIKVLDKQGSQVYYFPDVLDGAPLAPEDLGDYVDLRFDTVADMVASTLLEVGDYAVTAGYNAAGDGGDNVYQIVAAGTGMEDGGQYINLSTHQAKGLFGTNVSLKQYGCLGDGATDDTFQIQRAVDFCLHNGYELFCPAGTYIIAPKTNAENQNPGTAAQIRLDRVNADGQGLVIRGAGMGRTIFKDKDGESAAGGNFTRTFFCWLDSTEANTYELGHYHFSDFSIDKNARSNGVPPTLFAWEGNHMIAFQGNAGVVKLPSVTVERLQFLDKVGTGIAIGPSDVDAELITASDIHSPLSNHPTVAAGTIGGKGCLELALDSELTVIDSCNLHYSQIEPTHASDPGRVRRIKVDNCAMATFEYTDSGGFAAGVTYSYVDLSNTHCNTGFVARGIKLNANNCRLKDSIENYYIDSHFSNCTFLLDYDSSGNSVDPWYANTPATMITAGVATEVTLDGCAFIIDSDSVAASPSGYALRANLTTTEYGSKVSLNNCRFDTRLFGVVDAYSTGGHWRFSNCEMAGHTRAVRAGAFSSYVNSVELNDCDFSKVTGVNINILSSDTTYKLKVNGSYDASEWSQDTSGATAIEPQYFSRPRLFGTAAPVSGSWFIGDKVYNHTPSVDGNNMILEHWVCTVKGTPGTWVPQYVSTVSPAT